MKKILIIAGAVILIAVAGRTYWAYQQATNNPVIAVTTSGISRQTNATPLNTGVQKKDDTHIVCIIIDASKCPPLSLADKERMQKAVTILSQFPLYMVDDKVMFASNERYVLIRLLEVAPGGSIEGGYVLVDIEANKIVNKFDSPISAGYTDRLIFDMPTSVYATSSPTESIGMYIFGAPNILMLKNSTVPAFGNETYTANPSRLDSLQIIATSSESITLAVFNRDITRIEQNQNYQKVSQKAFLFSEATIQ